MEELICPKWQVVKENGTKSQIFQDKDECERINQKVKGEVVPVY